MAGLASKLVPIIPGISNNVSAPSKLLAVQAINGKVRFNFQCIDFSGLTSFVIHFPHRDLIP